MATIDVSVATRETKGSNAGRRLRRAGKIPAVLYGEGKDPVSVSVEARVVERILHSKTGQNTLLELSLDGTDKKRLAMIHDYQLDPSTDALLHADFMRVRADHAVHVAVHISLDGVPVGVKTHGGRMDNPVREVLIECLPKDIPTAIHHDVSALDIGAVIHASDLAIPERCQLLSDPTTLIAAVHAKAAEEAPAAEGAEGEVPGAPAATGEGEQEEKKD